MKKPVNSEKDLSTQQQGSQSNSEFTNQTIAATSYNPGSSQDNAESESTPQDIKHGLQIVHATPGRVRLRTTDTSVKSVLDDISQQLRQQQGIEEVYTNQQTGSLVVTFNPNKLSLPQMLGVLQEVGADKLQASLPEEKTDIFAAWKSVEFWKEQGISFIPLFTGLAVTGGLGISGLPAIPVYLVTANVTRKLIDYLQLEATDLEVDILKSITAKDNAVDKTKEAVGAANIAYKVVHAIPGRIRLNVPKIAQDYGYTKRLQSLLKADAQVTNVRINRDAASVVISYKPGVIPDSELHWVDLIQLAGDAKLRQNSLNNAATVATTTTEQPSQAAEIARTTAIAQQPTQAKAQTTTTADTQQPSQEDDGESDIPIDSITVIEQLPDTEATSVWADFKSPALYTSLEYMAKFDL